MDRLLSLLPRAAPIQPHAAPAEMETSRLEDIAIQKALDEVLEYHRVHRPKNTTKNYEPKQREWRVSAGPPALRLLLLTSLPLPHRPCARRWTSRRVASTSLETMSTRASCYSLSRTRW